MTSILMAVANRHYTNNLAHCERRRPIGLFPHRSNALRRVQFILPPCPFPGQLPGVCSDNLARLNGGQGGHPRGPPNHERVPSSARRIQ
jgi:hypothetical protein